MTAHGLWLWLLALSPLMMLALYGLAWAAARDYGPRAWLVVWWGGVGVLVVLGNVLAQSLDAFRMPSGRGDPAFSPIFDFRGLGIVLAQGVATIAPLVAALGWAWAGLRLDWRQARWITWLGCAAWLVPTAAAWAWVDDHGPCGQLTDVWWHQHQFRLIRRYGKIVAADWDKRGRHFAPISRVGLERLSRLPHLEELALASSGLTDDEVRYLARLPRLRKLDLGSCRQITDAGIEHLRGHPSLEELNLTGTAVTDACIPALLSMPRLRAVPNSSTEISNAADRALHQELRRRGRVP